MLENLSNNEWEPSYIELEAVASFQKILEKDKKSPGFRNLVYRLLDYQNTLDCEDPIQSHFIIESADQILTAYKYKYPQYRLTVSEENLLSRLITESGIDAKYTDRYLELENKLANLIPPDDRSMGKQLLAKLSNISSEEIVFQTELYRFFGMMIAEDRLNDKKQSYPQEEEINFKPEEQEALRQTSALHDITLSELTEGFISFLVNEKNISRNTNINYRYNLGKFMKFIGNKNLDQLSQQDLRAFLAFEGERLGPASMAANIVCLKSFFKYLFESGYIEENIAASLKIPKIKRKPPKDIPEPEEVKEWIEKIRDPRNRMMIELILGTGIRRFELATLTWQDIDYKNELLRIREGKGNKDRIVPLSSSLIAALKKYEKGSKSGPIFKGRRGGFLHPGSINIIFFKISEDIGRKITPHFLRHTFATYMARCSGDIRALQEMMGHSSIETTAIYISPNLKQLREALNRHPLANEENKRNFENPDSSNQL